MYEIFGNFDSIEELNACAVGLEQELAGWMEAAMGKLDVEGKAYKNNQIPVEPVLDYLRSLCIEEQFARHVRRRTKSVKDCMELIEKNCKKEHLEGLDGREAGEYMARVMENTIKKLHNTSMQVLTQGTFWTGLLTKEVDEKGEEIIEVSEK